MSKNKTSFSILTLLFLLLHGNAQISLSEISLKEQIKNSTQVIEGKVLGKKSFWDTNHKMIYSVHTIEVYKVFKGEPVNTLEIITEGGFVGMEGITVSHGLELNEGDFGVFTLHDANISFNTTLKSTLKQFKVYSSMQGYYRYDLYLDEAVNIFKKVKGIKNSLYKLIFDITKKNYIEMTPLGSVINKKSNVTTKTSLVAVNNISFSPTTITAGAKSVLTINGTGFGNSMGTVGFRNADDGGNTFINALNTELLSWSDTQITVEVPSDAGSGNIRVTDSNGASATSSGNLTVSFSNLNVINNSGVAFPTQHYNDNGLGGYTWEMESRFFNDSDHPGAKAAFLAAIDTWRCTTKINWSVNNTASQETTRETSGNLVAFDGGTLAELPAGVLGITYTQYAGRNCSSSGIIWFVTGFDIIFNKDVNWYFGNGTIQNGQFDFESVALHELGHAHQLGHVINQDDLMHFQTRSRTIYSNLHTNSIAGGNAVQVRSTTNQICGINPPAGLMVNYSGTCTLSHAEETWSNSIHIFPNPTKDRVNILNESVVKLDKVILYDMSGRIIAEYPILNNDVNTINLSGVSKGIYFINILSKNTVITKKIILE